MEAALQVFVMGRGNNLNTGKKAEAD